jgi:hypothetical protein
MPEYAEHGIVVDDARPVHITCITNADLYHFRITKPVQLLLAVHIILPASADYYFVRIGQRFRLG